MLDEDWFEKKNKRGAELVREALDEYFENDRKRVERLIKFCHEALNKPEEK